VEDHVIDCTEKAVAVAELEKQGGQLLLPMNDFSKPPWRLYVYKVAHEKHKAALVLKVAHSLGDGIELMTAWMNAFCNSQEEVKAQEAAVSGDRKRRDSEQKLHGRKLTCGTLLRRLLSFVASAVEMFFLPLDPDSVFRVDPLLAQNGARKFLLTPSEKVIPLERVKKIGKCIALGT